MDGHCHLQLEIAQSEQDVSPIADSRRGGKLEWNICDFKWIWRYLVYLGGIEHINKYYS